MKNLFYIAVCFVFAVSAKANITLPPIISDHMVLQQNMPVKLWGNASPGEQVTATIFQQKVTTTTDASGKWVLWLKPLKPAEKHGPYHKR